MRQSRRDFIAGVGMTLATGMSGCVTGVRDVETDGSGLAQWQRDIGEVTPRDYFAYLNGGDVNFSALKRLDCAFDKVLEEANGAKVSDIPAVWLVYNMGIVVKSRETLFSVDLCHRRADEIAPLLDFALITHNHNDHYTTKFYDTMDWTLHKTVVSNFADNYGARANPYHDGKPSEFGGGYTRGGKAFKFRDVEIKTYVSDHNSYLLGYTMPFEITIGGFTIFHSGDSAKVEQLNPSRTPDLWFVHPRVGLKVEDGIRRFHPKTTVISHLNEFTHPKGHCRWTWNDGLVEKSRVEFAGGRAIMPLWGERVV